MDLVESGAIFHFKPLNTSRSREIGTDDTFNSSTRSKSNSRFEDLFLASPRAQELVSTVDQRWSVKRPQICTFNSGQQSLHELHGSMTPKTKTSSTCEDISLFQSGLVVNMTDFLRGSQSARNHSTLFSPFKASDFNDDILEAQVTDVILKLRTPVKSNDLNIFDEENVPPLGDTGDEEKEIDVGTVDEYSNVHPQATEITPGFPRMSNVLVVEKIASTNNVNFSSQEEQDIDCQFPLETDDDSLGNLDTGNIRAAEILPEKNSVLMKEPTISKLSNDNNPINAETCENKEPLPATCNHEYQAKTRQPHHLYEWCIKAVKTKASPPGIIVEGQRLEDPKGELWHSTTIVKRVSLCLVETKSKSQYFLEGELQEKITIEQGFSKSFVEAFKRGFPSDWKHIVQTHFDSIISTKPGKVAKKSTKHKVKSKSSHKQLGSQGKPWKSSNKRETKNMDIKPIEVELKRTSSGRLIKPPLAWWRGQRIITDCQHNMTAIEPGGEEHTALSVGLYDFDLKVPKSKISYLKRNSMTPKVAKFDLTVISPQGKSKTLAVTENKPKHITKHKTRSSHKTLKMVTEEIQQSSDNTEIDVNETDDILDSATSLNEDKFLSNASVRRNISFSDEESYTSASEETPKNPKQKQRFALEQNKEDTSKLRNHGRKAQEIPNSSDEEETEQHHKSILRIKRNTTIGVDASKKQNERNKSNRRPGKKSSLKETGTEDDLSSLDEEEEQAVADMLAHSTRDKRATSESQDSTAEESAHVPPLKKKSNKKAARTESGTSNRMQDRQQNIKTSSQSSRNQAHANYWQDDEVFRLSTALNTIPLSSPRFWQNVSEAVWSRTAQECQLKYDEQLNSRHRNAPSKEKPLEPRQKVFAITGGVGTVKRKRELRQLISQNNDGYEDDIFESTPFKKSKKTYKFSAKENYENESDGGDEEEEEAPIEDSLEYKTPSNRTPSSRLRPLGPASNPSNTPSADLISPSLLQPVDRAGMDHYIHRMKQRKRGICGQNRKPEKVKVVKTSTPKKKNTLKISKVTHSMFDVHAKSDQDSDDEADYYWSDQ